MTSLFDPVQLGALALNNRIVMAPLTRNRASEGRVPNDLMRRYYCQRASAGLIIAEATAISPQGAGYPSSPGVWTTAQVDGWKKITQAVHDRGGKIFLQLWHAGRVSDPELLQGEIPVAPSAIPSSGHVVLLRPKRPHVVPRALRTEEIPGIVADFAAAARHAKDAGFDGVEIHGANGYLLDQFLQDGANKRTDAYGGSIENRARLLLEVVDACSSIWGAGRVGVHLSPRPGAHGIFDSNPRAVFSYVAQALGERRIAFICTREYVGPDSLTGTIRRLFGGPVIANEGYDPQSARQAVSTGEVDAVAFGKAFIANPDLVARLKSGAAVNTCDTATFYSPGPAGYTDYPALPDEMTSVVEACA